MITRVDALLRPIELKNNDATHDGFYLDGIPYYQGRAYAEISFARDVAERLNGKFDHLVIAAAEYVNNEFKTLGYVSKEAVEKIEEILSPVAPFAKSYKMHLVGHAHMDMNWMWGYDETVNMVLSNISTIIGLMKEYPFLTFAQSQASVYEIIEKFGEKRLLSDIKELIRQGRWEVTATSFVENDKNLPCGESLVRQILLAKNYLKDLLDLTDHDLTVAFEPDTFGHSENMPEIYAKTGIKYLYFNRGSKNTPYLSRWVGNEGTNVLCYRDPRWYNMRIEPILTDRRLLESDCSGQKNLLTVFGTGDHGGGPTRRDINRLVDMSKWPIYPTFIFSTYKKYFEAVEREETCIAEISGEKNMIFTGCYSSQSRIKRANRIAERVLLSAEKYSAFECMLNGGVYPAYKLNIAWKNTLFNQFHDIITGSCVRESREYALGSFQTAMAYANSARSYALRRIADRIDTSAFITKEDVSSDTSLGAGGGTQNAMYGNYSNSTASGDNRVFTFFNSADTVREKVTEITVWDWQNPQEIEIYDQNSNILPIQIIDDGVNTYWGHAYTKVLVKVKVPALGYTCLFLRRKRDVEYRRGELCGDMNRQHFADSFVLENGLIKATFDTVSSALISFIDKRTGKELIKNAGFRFITEDTDRDLSSWRISRYKKIEPLTENVNIEWECDGILQKAIKMKYRFGSSDMTVRVSLDQNSPVLRFECKANFNEIGTKEKGIPQLNFAAKLNFDTNEYLYDIPFGVIKRQEQNIDCPASSFIFADGLMLHTDCKHGYRGFDQTVAVTLLRASYEPDKIPEMGECDFTVSLAPFVKWDNTTLLRSAFDMQNPFESVCQNASGGDMPLTFGFLSVDNALVSAIKYAESGDSVVIRLQNAEKETTTARLSCFKAIKRAFLCDALENDINKMDIDQNTFCVNLKSKSFETVKIYY